MTTRLWERKKDVLSVWRHQFAVNKKENPAHLAGSMTFIAKNGDVRHGQCKCKNNIKKKKRKEKLMFEMPMCDWCKVDVGTKGSATVYGSEAVTMDKSLLLTIIPPVTNDNNAIEKNGIARASKRIKNQNQTFNNNNRNIYAYNKWLNRNNKSFCLCFQFIWHTKKKEETSVVLCSWSLLVFALFSFPSFNRCCSVSVRPYNIRSIFIGIIYTKIKFVPASRIIYTPESNENNQPASVDQFRIGKINKRTYGMVNGDGRRQINR